VSARDIKPKSAAAEDMRDALDYAEWIQVESAARGKELSWDAAVMAGMTAQTMIPLFYSQLALEELVNQLCDPPDDEPEDGEDGSS
jgi:hypothetical protein